MAAKLKVADQESALMAALKKHDKATAKKLERDGPLLKLASRRMFARYVKEGGDPSNWQAFVEWLIKILPQIISLIALFA